MNTFDIYLAPSEGPANWSALCDHLRGIPHLHRSPSEPELLRYFNRDTTTHFNIVLGPEVLRAAFPSEASMPERIDALSEASGGTASSRADEEDDAEPYPPDDDEEEFDDDGEPAELGPEIPAVHLQVPLFRPTFFIREALALGEGLAEAAGAHLVSDADDGEGGEDGDNSLGDAAAVETAWRAANRALFRTLDGRARVEVWSEDRCAEFYAYGAKLDELRRRFEPEGLEVLPIQLAAHGDGTQTLCVWRIDRPAVLPKTDLVLVERPSEKRGLLRRRRIEEIIVSGKDVWDRVVPFAESQYDPVPMLLVRSAADSNAQLATSLEALEGVPASNAKRTQFGAASIVDFSIDDAKGPAGTTTFD